MNNPGIYFEMASGSRSLRHQIDPTLYRDPREYFRRIVEPFALQGCTDMLFHQMYGRTTSGQNTAMDYTNYYDLILGDEDDRKYAETVTAELHRFAVNNPQVRISIYIGAIWGPPMRSRVGTNDWVNLLGAPFVPYNQYEWPQPLHFVFDAVHDLNINDIEWNAYQSIRNALGPRRVLGEAMPRPERREQWGQASLTLERDYQAHADFDHPERLGAVTRVLNGADGGWSHWEAVPRSSGITATELFMLDCRREGHDSYVSPAMLERDGLGYKEAIERVDRIESRINGGN